MRKSFILFFAIFISIQVLPGQFSMQVTDPVKWTFRQIDQGNGKFELVFSANIQSPWHMYAMFQEQTGPIPTSINYEVPAGMRVTGEIREEVKPTVKYDEGFQFNVGAYYRKAEFRLPVQVEGEVVFTGSVEYQCCDDETCLPPFLKEFSFNLKGPVAEITTAVKPDTGIGKAAKSVENKDDTLISDTLDEPLKTDTIALQPVQVETGLNAEVSTPIEDGKNRSMGSFLLVAFLLGLAAILTPCVYPMIPMTISFFMRDSGSRPFAVLKGLVFGFSMILVYTGLGLLVALTGVDANVGNIISTHWIPNIIFFILFMIFALSFLGMFEIVLPGSLVNKVDRQAERGGLTGPFFMGLTTVLVSFSCTGPIVGSLLTEAAGGEVLKPVLGMFFFSLAFALPFTLLAIFPSMMKNLPKSGGWLNSVKVVLGFLMLAFGLKFLSSIDQAYHLKIFTREVFLAIWVVIAFFMGLYLLGKIRFSHDSELSTIGVPRMLVAMASFVFAIYLFTGIFGNELRSLSTFIPPKSAQSFRIGGGEALSLRDASETWCGPGKHDEIFSLPHGLKGYFSYEDGLNCAREKNKPVFLDFTGHFCSNCKQMENQVWTDPEVLRILRDEYVVISLYTDDKTRLPESEWITIPDGKVLKTIGEQNIHFEMEKFGTFATPWYVLLDHDGNLLTASRGKDLNIGSYRDFLLEGLKNFNKRN